MLRRVFVVLALAMLAPLAIAQERGPIVFAAASLTDALSDAGEVYAARTGRPAPRFSFAASSALARQIEQGADAALFISADEPWMDYLAERNLIEPRSRVRLLGNRLVLIAPKVSALRVAIAPGFDLAGALGRERLAMADPSSVPAGRYGQAALESLGAWAGVAGNVVRAENVRAALRFVELGEAGAGIVYATDAAASDAVRVLGVFPASTHPPISYPMALVRDAPAAAEARAFAAFLRGAECQAIFARYGFTPPPR